MSSTIKFRCLDNSGNNIFLIDSLQGVYSTNTTESTNSSTGSVLLHGGLSINKTTNSSSISQGGALTIAGGVSIAKDLHIGGNLTVYGTQTEFISQTLNISDNLIIVNSSPISGKDAGILFQRFQTDNDLNLGDVVNDYYSIEMYVSNTSANTITFNTSASSIDNYYNNWYIQAWPPSGPAVVRKIVSYVGSTRTATINGTFESSVRGSTYISNSIYLYNRIYASQYYKEDIDKFVLAYTANSSNEFVDIMDYVDLRCGSVDIFTTANSIGVGSGGSLTVLGGTSIEKDVYIGGNLDVMTRISTGNIIVTNISNGTLNVSTGLTSESALITNLNASNSTISSIINTNLTSSSIIITSNLLARGNSNTIGSIFTTGGNVGINNVSPIAPLSFSNTFGQKITLWGSSTSTNYGIGLQSGQIQLHTDLSSGNIAFGYGSSTSFSELMRIGNGCVGIGTTAPTTTLDVVGTAKMTNVVTTNITTTNLTITNSSITNSTITNILSTNTSSGTINVTGLTAGNINFTGNLYKNGSIYISSQWTTDTTGNLTYTGGNVGIGTINPGTTLDVVGTGKISTSLTTGALYSTNLTSTNIVSSNLSSASLNLSTGLTSANAQITNITTTNIIISNISSGTLNLSSGLTSANGLITNITTTNITTTNIITTNITSGFINIFNTSNSIGLGSGGSLTVLGGTSISKDVYIGQNLYVNGQNLSSISGSTTIGNYTGTGILEITGVSIGKTMSNTNYKIIGNLITTTNNTNIYTVSFKNLTTTTFDAVIYRIDSLGSGWSDTNLKLSWYITP